jgi:hypothetical protein
MRKTLALMVATLALLQAWSVIGQEMQDSLTPDSELEAPEALTDFLADSDNETVNDTLNDTVNETLIDTNLSTTSSQDAFLDLPVNASLIDTNLSTTASQSDFLDQPVNASLIDTSDPGTLTMREFLLGGPVEQPTSSYKKGAMMDSWTEESSAEAAPSSYTKGQPMA